MKFFSNTKLTKQTLKEIRQRLEDGERLSVQSIVTEFFSPKSAFARDISTKRANAWLCNLTKRYNTQGRMFGRLNEAGEYGFPNGEEEALHIGRRAYKFSKGHFISATRKISNGQNEGLIEASKEKIELLAPISLKILGNTKGKLK